MQNTLTPREQKALEFIEAYQERRGDHPTLRDIKEHMGYTCTTAPAQIVRKLVEKGYMFKTEKGKARLMKFQ